MGRRKKEKPNHGEYYEIKKSITDIFGNKTRKSFYSKKSKEDADRQGDEYQAKILIKEASGDNSPEKNITFKDWSKTWLETYKKGKVKDNTYHSMYCNVVNTYLTPYFGKKSISAIKPIDIQKFFDLCENKYSLETIKKMRSCLGAIFDTAIENGYAAKSPITKHISIASNIKPQKRRAYTLEQYNKLIDFCKKNNGLDVLLLAETAITRSELLGLKWVDIDFANKIIYIRQGTVNMKSTKDGVWRTVSDGLKNDYRCRPIPIVDDDLFNMLKNKPQTILVGGNVKKKVPPKEVKTEYVIYSPTGQIFAPDNWYRRVYRPFMATFNCNGQAFL